MNARITSIDKDTEHNTQQGRNGHGPADQAEHPEPHPDTLHAPAFRPELADFLRADLPAEIGIFTHDGIRQTAD